MNVKAQNPSYSKAPLLILIITLIIKTLCLIYAIRHAGIGLAPDEAQYWTWAQQLDWGYYSKPPGIAWQIRLGTELFGNTELGVRALAIANGSFLALAVYYLARCCSLKPSTACFAGLVMAFSPMGILGAFLATTDSGFIIFWTLACTVIAKALNDNTTPNYFLFGIYILCGALFKWPIYWLWVLAFLFYSFQTKGIGWVLKQKGISLGLVISLLGLLPSIIWNRTHEWATFRHVSSTIQGGPKNSGLWKGNFFDFIGAQAALLSPILFVLLIIAFVALIKYRKSIQTPLLFCGFVSIVFLGGNTLMSLVQKMQGNWAVLAYPTGIVLTCWYTCEKVLWGKKWLVGGLFLSVALSITLFALPYLQSSDMKSVQIPYKISPFKHNVGWNLMPQALNEAGYDPAIHFLFGDKYQTSSILSFYSNQQKRAYFFNLHGCRKNQFSYWPGMKEEQENKSGFFVGIIQNPQSEKDIQNEISRYQNVLLPYFKSIEVVSIKPLFFSYGTAVKIAIILKATDYNGQEPEDSCLY